MTSVNWPAWGILSDEYQADALDPKTLIPKRWTLPGTASPGIADWERFRNGLVNEIADLIWPRYDNGNWRGAAYGDMEKLTRTDFQLLKPLRSALFQPVAGQGSNPGTHEEFFKSEDDDNQDWGATYADYDPCAPKDLPKLIETGLLEYCGTLQMQLKYAFQRPRAYQVALLLGITNFTHRTALSAITPSLVSGHCLQSALAGCYVFLQFRQRGYASSDAIPMLKQFTVDIGDRRVFAGVHYPSDSLSSWYTALKMIPYVFPNDCAPVTDFLWNAIVSKSIVHEAMRRDVEASWNSPYEKLLSSLERLANSNCSRPA